MPLTERDSNYTFRAPDRIFVYRGPLTRMCESPEELVDEVRITVVHEIAHHFGIDDEAPARPRLRLRSATRLCLPPSLAGSSGRQAPIV